MTQERWLQWLGVLLAALILMLAAFSLGVVVGRHGWFGWQPEAALGRGGAPGGGPPPGGGGALPGIGAGPQNNAFPSPPQVVGQLRQRRGDGLTLATPQGPRSVQLTATTHYRTEEGETLTVTDLTPGDWLAVWGTWSQPNTLEATLVVRLQGPPSRSGP
ncbi:hypothetical protein [Thermoflexus sp.]|uniref:hypothetical protein n=1 Tax=Thermoflexus sp. TaxID=1969742 RepID=UPI0035E4229C